jgi:hypothetical protein
MVGQFNSGTALQMKSGLKEAQILKIFIFGKYIEVLFFILFCCVFCFFDLIVFETSL